MCVPPEHKTGLNGPLLQYDLPANKWQAFEADSQRMVGHDYYHNTMLWSLPPALLKQDIATFCGPDGFVDRILRLPNGR